MKTVLFLLVFALAKAGCAAMEPTGNLPKLVDLGAGKCIPCKQMKPILETLRTDYSGQLQVIFIDVWQERQAAGPYGIRMIPTQIFYAADGRELARHEGFMSLKDILAKWKALGVELHPTPRTAGP